MSKKDVPSIPSEGNEIHDWHAHLFYLNHRKHLIFTHSASLFSIVVFNVLKRDVAALESFFKKNLARCLYYEEFQADEINGIVNSTGQIQFLQTSDRHVIGSINEFVKIYRFSILWHEPAESDSPEFQRQLNTTPMSMLKMKYPIERFRECLLLPLKEGKNKSNN